MNPSWRAPTARVLIASALLGLVVWQRPAVAAPVTRTYDFEATHFFTAQGGASPPFTTVTGSVTVTFDTSFNRFDVTTGVLLNRFDLGAPGSALAYDYRQDIDRLVVGGIDAGANGVSGNLTHGDDFFVVIADASTAAPRFLQLTYGVVSHRLNVFSSFTGSLLPGDGLPPPAGVPAPSSLALLVAGGALLSRRRCLPASPARP